MTSTHAESASSSSSSTSYRVRRAERRDIPTIVEFQIAMALETESLHLDRDRVIRGVTIPFERQNLAEYVVVEHGLGSDGDEASASSVVAMLMITFEWSDWRGGNIFWIQSVYTHPEHRRRGLFKSLFQHVKDRVQNDPDAVAIRLYVEHENKVGISTYESLGLSMEEGYRMMKWSKLNY